MFTPEPRKQYLIHVDFSSSSMAMNEDKWQALQDIVAKVVSSAVGGCTLLPAAGYWSELPDNRADKDDYKEYDHFRETFAAQLQVKCEADGLNKLKQAIQLGFREAEGEYPEADLDWVCGSIQPVESFNFSLKG